MVAVVSSRRRPSAASSQCHHLRPSPLYSHSRRTRPSSSSSHSRRNCPSLSSSHSRRNRPCSPSSHSRRNRPSTSSRLYRGRSSPSAATDWVMLEENVHPRRRELVSSVAEAASRTSTGFDVSVSLSLAAPPASSFVYLHSPHPQVRRYKLSLFRGVASQVVAADGDLLLLLICVPGATSAFRCGIMEDPEDYFVYTADPLAPSLRLLPPVDDGERHNWYNIVGIARRHGGEYVVAAFNLVKVEVGKLWRFSSVTAEWEVKELAMPYDARKRGLKPVEWGTDAVFSYPSGAAMCWACFGHGLVICNVFDACPALQFVPFPLPMEGRRGMTTSFRNVGAWGGLIRFVDVDNSLAKEPGFRLTTWTLLMPEMSWRNDAVLDAADLWSTAAYRDSRLPRLAPEFPTGDLQDPDVLHVLLQDCDKDDGIDWMITINVSTKTLLSYRKYRNNEQGNEFKNIFCCSTFVCSHLPKYLNPDLQAS